MGILEKTIALAGAAVGGVALAKDFLGGKKKKIAALDTEFAKITSDYQAKKNKLVRSIENGDSGAARKLEKLERHYSIQKAEYENTRLTLLPSKSKVDIEREGQELEKQLEIEKARAFHEIEMDKVKTMHSLEMEKSESEKSWYLQDNEVMHGNEMEKTQTLHEQEIEKMRVRHSMEMEKLELASRVGISAEAMPAVPNVDAFSICQNCGNKNAIGSKFCGSCGSALSNKKFCTNCGASIGTEAKFCSSCGQAVGN